MTIKEEIQIEEYKRTFAEAYKQGFIDAMSVCKTEPRKEQNFCSKCRYLYRDFKYGLSCYRLMDNEPCKYEARKTENSSEKPNSCEPQTEEWYTYQDEQEYNARHGKE